MARYELMDRIGVGGMAEVFRGKAIAGGGFEKPVAIKRILPHLSQDKRFVELLIAEAKTLSQLRQRNVVQIYDVGLGDDGQYFLVMEFVDGVDLGALCHALEQAGRGVSLEVALHLVSEVCEALDHAHRARGADARPLGLVHRDVAPSNILLSASGEVKLTDFGIAKRMEEATGHGGVRGKFAYISPEQAMNARVDARSDVYSLGVVLYELALGERLYSHLPDFDALRAVREARSPRLAERGVLDAELAIILDTALAPAPGERFPTAGAFGARLRGYRYSLSSAGADPTTEIARLVDAHRRGRLGPEAMGAEPTVVRIATAVGFGPGLTGDGATIARPPRPGFDDEETRAVDTQRSGPPPTMTFDDLETRPVAAGLAGLAHLGGRGSRLTSHRATGTPAEIPGPLPRLAPRSTASPSGGLPPLDDATTLDASAAPPTSHRRLLLVTGALCIVCAVIAFVVVGALSGSSPAAAPPIDAGPPAALDAAVPTADAAPERATPVKKRTKKRARPARTPAAKKPPR